MTVVIDSSMALAWCFEDEQTPEIIALLQRVQRTGAAAPVHWPLEIANGLRTAVRQNRITKAYRDTRFSLLRTLPIQIDHRTNENAWSATVEISDRLGLTPYDAAYLELALRLTFPLATLDRQLVQAGRAAKIPILGLTIGE